MLGNRSFAQLWSALTGKQHYIALTNMVKVYPSFFANTARYLFALGDYPYDIELRSPVGSLQASLYSHHDILTVNEIFCRTDYPATAALETVVDIGSNIGISALYFLSRNSHSKCYLYEPDQRNIEKLRVNLATYSNRFELVEKAVSYERGQLEFGIEETGRYGGIGVKTDRSIVVECLEINDVLQTVIEQEGRINILKIDTEGVEIKTVEAIRPDLLDSIDNIYLEAKPDYLLHPEKFHQTQYGSVCQLTQRHN